MPAARLLAATVIAALLASPAVAEWGWNPFRSKPKAEPKRVAPMPVQQASAEIPVAPAASFDLTDASGPWLILAATFSGEGAEEQAYDLAMELRRGQRWRTYLHDMKFDLASDEPLGRGVDRYGAPIKMKYRSGESREEWAVLIGDYPAVDDTIAERDLAAIKQVQPQSLRPDADGHTTQNFAGFRQVAAALTGKGSGDGPMRTAFITRNPLLPEEFFVPKGVDKFVEKMNKDVEHSALEIKGRYAVKVATFRARGTLMGAAQARSSKSRRGKKDDDALVEAAWNAHCLCEEMRRQGWDAYEFHDRTESCVMVGSFDAVKHVNGQPKAEVMEVIRAFGAAHEGSQTPLAKQRLPSAEAQRKELEQTFNNLFTAEVGQVAGGMNPKYAHVRVSDDKNVPLKAIPFDIHPHVVEAPKKSVSSGFAWRR